VPAQFSNSERGQRDRIVATRHSTGRRYFDLGRNASYEAARRGDIPTIKIGRLLRVPVIALERKLEECDRR
jgi:hypothetical protein